MGCSERDARRPRPTRGRSRAHGSPAPRRRRRSARTCSGEAGPAIRSADTPATAPGRPPASACGGVSRRTLPRGGAAIGDQLLEGGPHAVGSLALDEAGGVGTGDEDEVVGAGELVRRGPEGLPERALDGVALDGAADLATDRDPEARPGLGVVSPWKRIEDEEAVATRAAVSEDAVEVAAASEALAASPGTATRHQGVSRLRPFRRRRRITSRPARVRIRARNPWVRARLRFFGWYVRFTARARAGRRGRGPGTAKYTRVPCPPGQAESPCLVFVAICDMAVQRARRPAL